MVFAGADIDDAFAAVRQEATPPRLTTPPAAPRTPFSSLLRSARSRIRRNTRRWARWR
jgi:hypothetical protein